MPAMRYAITLPGDYDMTIIRNRVAKSGHLMDGFQDLPHFRKSGRRLAKQLQPALRLERRGRHEQIYL